MSASLRAERRSAGDTAKLLDPTAPLWSALSASTIPLAPTPVALVAAVSPYVAASTGHGRVPGIELRAVHDGVSLLLRLGWPDTTRDDSIADLDRFADAAAVIFPLAPGADPFHMGSPGKPVNAWLWRADAKAPFDVIAEGYATSQRRPAGSSGLEARAAHDGRGWSLVFRRPLTAPGVGFISLAGGASTGIGFAVWDGSARDRSAAKAVSAGLRPLVLAG